MRINKKKIVRAILAASVLTAVAAGGLAAKQWLGSRPTIENFDRVIRSTMALTSRDTRDAFGDEQDRACIYLSDPPQPSGRSRGRLEMATHVDIPVDEKPVDLMQAYIKKAETLTRLGLLEKSPVIASIDGAMKEATRYRLSPMGWQAYGFAHDRPCFFYGKPEYLGVTGFEPYEAPGRAQHEQYFRVSTRTGILGNLPAWALDPELQSLFPEMKSKILGEKNDMYLRKVGLHLGFPFEDELHKQERDRVAKLKAATVQAPASDKEKISSGAILDEVKRALIKMHASYDPKYPPASQCLYLPGGSDDFPVDLNRSTGAKYEVAIFSDKPRTEMDKVGRTAVPYLERMASLGVLSQRNEAGVPGAGQDSGKLFDASFYTVADQYLGSTHPNIKACFPLGPATLEFIDLHIRKTFRDVANDYTFRYKARMLFKQTPAWTNTPLLSAGGWPELRLAQDRGQVCKGEFHFDREKQEINGGAASCWWAFDDNYDSR